MGMRLAKPYTTLHKRGSGTENWYCHVRTSSRRVQCQRKAAVPIWGGSRKKLKGGGGGGGGGGI